MRDLENLGLLLGLIAMSIARVIRLIDWRLFRSGCPDTLRTLPRTNIISE